ncbi:hypothetical protein SAMN04488023_12352 [Pedobacter rhizosphaerae]|uniref:Uncharacterized protein n=1 Tax=Pedobacter rhizosphaerae TaxID=390241 RepID=A0A1H9TL30_9SPHI|nr:hypothetical protein SAMN04488023_12352 [Pedobacter rhizosphaerae]
MNAKKLMACYYSLSQPEYNGNEVIGTEDCQCSAKPLSRSPNKIILDKNAKA